MKRTILVEPSIKVQYKYQASVIKEPTIPTFHGMSDSEAVGHLCIYLNEILDSSGQPEYIGEIKYSNVLTAPFKK